MKNFYERIIKWNIVRNDLKFDPDLESDMLSEESKEFMEAYKKFLTESLLPAFQIKVLVDMIDAYCDYYFVATGTKAKIGMNNHCFKYKEATSLLYLMDNQLGFMYNILNDILGNNTYDILMKSLGYVIEANETKPTKRDEKGKVVKGDKWIDPKDKIEKLLLEKGINNG